MTYEEFVASCRKPNDAEWSEILNIATEGGQRINREQCRLYAEGYLIELKTDGYYPHAWWYAPTRHATREEAEKTLFDWRKEWV